MPQPRNEQVNHSPVMIAYSVQDGKEKDSKGFWTRIGAAWEHNDGGGYNIQLNCFPLDGKIVLRVPLEDDKDKEEVQPATKKTNRR